MKRFWKDVAVEPGDAGFEVRLDGRPVRTPARAALVLPTPALAEAVAEEWRAAGETVDPRAMAATGLANAAIDRVAPDPTAFARELARYAETDLLCYRAADPPELIAREAAAWDPILGWARSRFDVHFEIATGVVHRAQPAATVARLGEAVAARGIFALAGLSPLVTIGGSLVTALGVVDGAVDPAEGFAATHLDELWQAEQWGEDYLAAEARAARERDWLAAARFVGLVGRD